jgi:nucleoside-diphosphate-sugar epimerase
MGSVKPSVVIIGCGYVGDRLASELVVRNIPVLGVRRTPPKVGSEFPYLQLDVSKPFSVSQFPQNFTHVVYAVSADEYSEAAYESAYVTGALHLSRALRDGPGQISRLVFVSSTGVYSQNGGEWVDEDSSTEPASFAGKCLLEGEKLISESFCPWAVLRFSGIYGPGRDRLIRQVREGGVVSVSDSPVYSNRIHVDDCVGSLMHLLFGENMHGIFIGSDDAPVDRTEVYAWVAARCGVDLRLEKVFAMSKAGEPGQGKRCKNDKLKASGYRFKYPTYREGYAELV